MLLHLSTVTVPSSKKGPIFSVLQITYQIVNVGELCGDSWVASELRNQGYCIFACSKHYATKNCTLQRKRYVPRSWNSPPKPPFISEQKQPDFLCLRLKGIAQSGRNNGTPSISCVKIPSGCVVGRKNRSSFS